MNLRSMTGYGMEVVKSGYAIELRALNGRYLEINIRLPQELYRLESKFRDILREYFERGSLELNISRRLTDKVIGIPRLNAAYARYYIDILKEISSMSNSTVDYSVLLQIKDIIYIDIDEEGILSVSKSLEEGIRGVCEKVLQMRENEGIALKGELQNNLRRLERLNSEIGGLRGRQNEVVKKNLDEKIKEFMGEGGVDESRFEEEVLYFVNRLDISEEVERIESHIVQFDNLLNEGGPVGRRLDFLCQEILRELNTIGSKSALIEIKRCVIEGKDVIEKIREQVQNIE
jgi:uncharacterized protein (TIGR00255 family)